MNLFLEVAGMYSIAAAPSDKMESYFGAAHLKR